MAGAIKVILQATGKEAGIDQWNDAVSTLVDMILGSIAFVSAIMGALHASRGPAHTSERQAAIIASILKPESAHDAIEEVTKTSKAVENDPKPKSAHLI